MLKRLFLLTIIVLSLSSCPSPRPDEPDPSPQPEPTPQVNTYTIVYNFFEKDTNNPINNIMLDIIETGFNERITENNYEHSMEEGVYTIYLSKEGYRASGYVLNVNMDLTINVKLKLLETPPKDYEIISGNVNENGNAFTSDFSVCRGIENYSDISDISGNPEGVFSSLSTLCGGVTISAFTKSVNKIENIVYLKNQILEQGSPLSGIVLNFTDRYITYTGIKPEPGDLKVKLNNDGLLAVQDPIPGDTGYSFNIDMEIDDSVSLESVMYDGNNTIFSRIYAGDTGGSNDIIFELDIPDISIDDSGNFYSLSFDNIAGSTIYESYVLEISQGNMNVPLKTSCLTGNILKIPKNLLNNNTDTTIIYLSAIIISDYSQTEFLENTLSYNEYSYSEAGGILINEKSMYCDINYRKIKNYNYLLSE